MEFEANLWPRDGSFYRPCCIVISSMYLLDVSLTQLVLLESSRDLVFLAKHHLNVTEHPSLQNLHLKSLQARYWRLPLCATYHCFFENMKIVELWLLRVLGRSKSSCRGCGAKFYDSIRRTYAVKFLDNFKIRISFLSRCSKTCEEYLRR